MTQAQAELFAARVLGWLAEDHARIGAFLTTTGTAPGALRNVLDDPVFLLGVLDFLMSDEALLIDCCTGLETPVETPAAARAALPGGAEVHWT
ncbi:DUF3572 domain-containing protein [Pararhodobacter sp. SW119]|uniref:DUF3572 domain-containing protein n=1 Tax=Pararhodobacter sp. SW119 TaxID=2780075 RepID=UPI001ADEDD03|nr:DUF3572 domain-containing protein [Pararhodobacter sp. SW119]